MSRLWKRVGVFRPLAVVVLVLGVIGGVALSIDRPTQRRPAKSVTAQVELEPAQYQESITADVNDAERDAQNRAERAADAAVAQAVAAAATARGGNDPSRSNRPARPSVPGTPIPASCDGFKTEKPNGNNQAIACALLPKYGFAMDQMRCLVPLWTKESGWNQLARNSSSGAYGIAQALPGSRMAVHGADWRTNPETQIKWGIGYVKDRYKSPCGAWGFFQDRGWY